MQTTMAQGLPQSTSHQNVRVVRMEPHVKSAETCKLSNRGVSGNAKTGKSADPTCYNACTVEIGTGLFDIVEMKMIEMQNGDMIRFKTTGHEIADVRNKNPAKEWTGVMCGGPNEEGTHVVLWCERERREAGHVMVAIENIIANETLGIDKNGAKLPRKQYA